MSTLLLVGHGSRDPRSAQALRSLADRVAAAAGPTRVDLAFLELSEPVLEDVAADLVGEVVVVPLLLGGAFHARFDLPARLEAIGQARADVRFVRTPVLGPAAELDGAIARGGAGLVGAGCDGLVLLGTGSSHARVNAEADAVAARVGRRLGVAAAAGFVTRGRSLEASVAGLRRAGAARIGLVPWFLAPGRLLDEGRRRAADLGVAVDAPPLAQDPLLVDLVLARARRAWAVAAAA